MNKNTNQTSVTLPLRVWQGKTNKKTVNSVFLKILKKVAHEKCWMQMQNLKVRRKKKAQKETRNVTRGQRAQTSTLKSIGSLTFAPGPTELRLTGFRNSTFLPFSSTIFSFLHLPLNNIFHTLYC